MSNSSIDKPGKLFGAGRRSAVRVAEQDLVKTTEFQFGALLPLVVQPAVEGLDLVAWASTHKAWIESQLLSYGGILFRNFGVISAATFERFFTTMAGELLEYTYRSTPRSRVSGNIYTSTEYPSDQSIPMHNEMSYTRNWPMKIGFCCIQAAVQGGETPIADSRKVYDRIDPNVRERFAHKQVMYVRNYGEGLDLTWEDVFQTSDRDEVEAFCRAADIEFEWKDANRLRTRQICQAVARHPQTGELVWFNQAHLFHVSSLPPVLRDALLAQFDKEDLPRNTYYGDGSPIEPSVLDTIRAAYARESISFPWQAGDIVVLDNMLVAHGRAPFIGPRKVVVGMAQPASARDFLD